jgi:hypothetical protein
LKIENFPLKIVSIDCGLSVRNFQFSIFNFQFSISRCPSVRNVLYVLSIGIALLLSSCSSGRKPVYPTRGQVLAKNQEPAVGAFVIFHPVNAPDTDPNKPRAYVEEDGSFRLTTYQQGDGAPEGEYVVTIDWRPPSASPFGPNKRGADRLAGRYSKVENSKFRFKIEKKSVNELPPIQLD